VLECVPYLIVANVVCVSGNSKLPRRILTSGMRSLGGFSELWMI
jgi:hypothetical protein